ncbi:MAG: hypothetical protein RIQ88_390 [Actinomycetota bacterium]|jgi:hypothetical protein
MSNVSFTNPNNNTYKIVSASIYGLIAAISVFTGSSRAVFDLFQYALTLFSNFSGDYLYALVILQGALSQLLLPLGAITLGVMVFVSQSRKLFFWSNISWALFVMPLTWMVTAIYVSSSNFGIPLTPEIVLFQGLIDPIFGYLIILLVVASSVLALLGRNSVADAASTQPVEGYVGNGTSQLPLITIICAFFFPIVGIITGHLALSQIKRGQISPENKNLATIGLALSYVFTALSVMALVLVFSWLALLANWRSY